jgi:hypothetical protein
MSNNEMREIQAQQDELSRKLTEKISDDFGRPNYPEATDLNFCPYCGYINRNNCGQSTLKSRLRLVACVTLFTCTSSLLVINFDNVGRASLPMVIASLPFRRNEIVIS